MNYVTLIVSFLCAILFASAITPEAKKEKNLNKSATMLYFLMFFVTGFAIIY